MKAIRGGALAPDGPVEQRSIRTRRERAESPSRAAGTYRCGAHYPTGKARLFLEMARQPALAAMGRCPGTADLNTGRPGYALDPAG